MSEWWTYSLSSFLLFSARTYYRLFELYNSAIWPGQIFFIALGMVMLGYLLRGGAGQGRIVTAILAACWLWVAWAFHMERYATINWAARYFAAGFAIEALLLVRLGFARPPLSFKPVGSAIDLAGLCVFLFALFAQPLIGPIMGRSWRQVELFGMAPDPTVIATLGIVLMSNRSRWALLPIPLAWCAISGATLWTMASQDALMLPVIALLALLLAAWKTLSAMPSSPRDFFP